MEIKRLLVAGAVGAGKSTFVRSIGEIGVVDTEEIATDETALIKPTTTVVFDFSRVTLPQYTLHVYGTPGQYRFNFIWEMLIEQAHVLLLLVAAHRPDDFKQTQKIIAFMQKHASKSAAGQSQLPMMLGITHTDCPDAIAPEEIVSALELSTLVSLPVLTINPLDRISVANALATVADGVFHER
ncbi:ATP/GTP-binding protein [Leptolyngbya sp. FACHB-36]|uniref:GTP-binding protein n=1 Tax=Leptolyngbya sp. FACHB-36 TaxID=2692808 RepID=UPI001680053E|nr:ATP/GTP-binding protein [Leptolyngbya sp. FACHB-36]MBD2019477.1 ATP/GTP-binding protein [Leptolyngbya sp. FACHB-36]